MDCPQLVALVREFFEPSDRAGCLAGPFPGAPHRLLQHGIGLLALPRMGRPGRRPVSGIAALEVFKFCEQFTTFGSLLPTICATMRLQLDALGRSERYHRRGEVVSHHEQFEPVCGGGAQAHAGSSAATSLNSALRIRPPRSRYSCSAVSSRWQKATTG